jgi:colicin import membrane protein
VEAAVGGGDPALVKVLEAKAKEERKRAEDLTKLLDEEKRRAEAEAKRADAAERAAAAASAAAAAAGSGKAAVAAAPDPALLKELADRKRELEETKRLLAAAEAKRPAPAAPAPGPDPKLTAELEAQKRQIADLLREKKAMEEKLARGATQPPASARGAQAQVQAQAQAKTAPAASLSLEGTRPATAAPATASSKQPAGKAKQQGQAWIDWNTHPLPSGWDRKKDAATGRVRLASVFLSILLLHLDDLLTLTLRPSSSIQTCTTSQVYYVDHVHKKTQWKHPQYVPPQKDEPDEESQHDEE